MNIARQLWDLQQLDLGIEETERTTVQLTSRLGESQELIGARNALAAARQRLEELAKTQRSLEWEADDMSSKIKVIDGKLYGGKVRVPKELTDLLHESDALKAARKEVEDKALAAMEDVEKAQADVKARETELKQVEIKWVREQEETRAELERLRGVLVDLNKQREQAAARTESRALAFYETVRKQKRPAVARVEQGTCRGCRISLSTAELQRARAGELVTCSTCGRILFLA